MAIEVEMLRLLYFTNLYQPIEVKRLRELHLEATGESGAFRQLLQNLREEGLLSESDPTYCTGNGLAYVERVGLSKRRDVGRMFLLKDMLRTGKL
jgi:hypothetical protein